MYRFATLALVFAVFTLGVESAGFLTQYQIINRKMHPAPPAECLDTPMRLKKRGHPWQRNKPSWGSSQNNQQGGEDWYGNNLRKPGVTFNPLDKSTYYWAAHPRPRTWNQIPQSVINEINAQRYYGILRFNANFNCAPEIYRADKKALYMDREVCKRLSGYFRLSLTTEVDETDTFGGWPKCVEHDAEKCADTGCGPGSSPIGDVPGGGGFGLGGGNGNSNGGGNTSDNTRPRDKPGT